MGEKDFFEIKVGKLLLRNVFPIYEFIIFAPNTLL